MSRNVLPKWTTVSGSHFEAAAVGPAGNYDTDKLAIIVIDETGKFSIVENICGGPDWAAKLAWW